MEPDRWRRRLSSGDALSSSEALRLSDAEAERVANRAERATQMSRVEPASIRREAVEQLTVDEFEVGQPVVEPFVDLTDPIDLRSETAAVESEVQSERETVSAVPAPPAASATPTTPTTPIAPTESTEVSSVTPPPPAMREEASDHDSGSAEGPDLPDPPTSSDPSSFSAETTETTTMPIPVDIAPESSLRKPIRQVDIVPVPPEQPGRRSGLLLLLIAAALAVITGILGTMLLLERSNSADLRDEVERAQAGENVAVAGLEEVNDDVRTLELENDRLQQQLNDMSALVLELPEGRVTEIAVPFTPTFADEADNGRLIAVSAEGEYIIWGDGAEGAITDSGNLSGAPTGLFAATGKAWVSTDAGQIEALSLVTGVDGLPAVEVGPTLFLAPEERGYWTFDQGTSAVVRRKKSDSSVTTSVAVPADIVDLTIGAGSVWALGDDGRVYRINTADLTVAPLDVGEDLISITAGPDALWTLSAADGSLRRVDAVSGEVLVTVPVGRDPIDATFAGGSVWVPLRSGSSLIEVDTRTAAVVSRTPLPSEPTGVHQGETGVYITTAGDSPLYQVSSLGAGQVDPSGPSDDS